jgi:hypothetical protein
MHIVAELLFKNSIDASDFLLFPELDAIIGMFRPTLTMLTGRVIPSLHGAFVRVASISFQEQLRLFTAAEPANRFSITCQANLL